MAAGYTKNDSIKRSLLNHNHAKVSNAEDYDLELENDSFLDQVGPSSNR